MNPVIEADYLASLRCPCLNVGNVNYTLTIEAAEAVAQQLQHAALRARLEERQAALRDRFQKQRQSSPASEESRRAD